MEMVDIMLAALSILLVVKYLDTQVGCNEVIALFCRDSSLGFVAVLQIQSLPL